MKDHPETHISRLEEKRPEESWESLHCEILFISVHGGSINILYVNTECSGNPEQAFSNNVIVNRCEVCSGSSTLPVVMVKLQWFN